MITAIIISAVAGIAVGAIGMNVLGNDVSSQSASVDINTDAPETIEAVGGVVDSVVAEDVTDAQTRASVVEASPQALLAQAVIDLGNAKVTSAAFGFSLCIAGAQGLPNGTDALDCDKRGDALDKAVGELVDRPVVAEPAE